MCNYCDGSLLFALLGDNLITLLLPNSRRRKSKLGCLLCALSSSLSSLALADLHLIQLQLPEGTQLQVPSTLRSSMIQQIIHESCLQTIKINVCGFRPNGGDDLELRKLSLR